MTSYGTHYQTDWQTLHAMLVSIQISLWQTESNSWSYTPSHSLVTHVCLDIDQACTLNHACARMLFCWTTTTIGQICTTWHSFLFQSDFTCSHNTGWLLDLVPVLHCTCITQITTSHSSYVGKMGLQDAAPLLPKFVSVCFHRQGDGGYWCHWLSDILGVS